MYSKKEIKESKSLVEKSFKYYYNVAVSVFRKYGLSEQYIKKCLNNANHADMIHDLEIAILTANGMSTSFAGLLTESLFIVGSKALQDKQDFNRSVILDYVSDTLAREQVSIDTFEHVVEGISILSDCIDVLWVSIYGKCFSVDGYLSDTLSSVINGKGLLKDAEDMRIGWKVNNQNYIIQLSKTDSVTSKVNLLYGKWVVSYSVSIYLDLGSAMGFLFDFYLALDNNGNPHAFMAKQSACEHCDKLKFGYCKEVELTIQNANVTDKASVVKYGRNTLCNNIPFLTDLGDTYVYTIGISDVLKLLQHVMYIKTNKVALVKAPGGSTTVKQNVRSSYKEVPVERNYISTNLVDMNTNERQGDIMFVNSYLHKVAERVVKPWQGGHHASPAPHERRGTFRRCKNGSHNYVDGKFVYVGKPNGTHVPVRGSLVNVGNNSLVVKNVKIK